MRGSGTLKWRTILFLSGLPVFILLSLGLGQPGWGDTVQAFGLVENGTTYTQTHIFNDGSVVYVRVNDGVVASGSYPSVMVKENGVSNQITVTVYDNGTLPDDKTDDTYYWGFFTLRQGDGSGTDDTNDVLELSNAEKATVTADLGIPGNPGSTEVTAGFSTFTDHSNPFLAVSVSADSFSPDGDGVNDTTTISITVSDSSTPIYGRVEIRDSSDVMVRNLYTPANGALSTGSYTWDGKYDGGGIVPNGTYKVYVIALDNAENSSQQTTAVKVETTCPEISEVSVSPGTISPQNDDGLQDSCTITFKAVRTGGGLTFKIYDGTTLVRDLTSGIAVVGDHYSVTWNGKDDTGSWVDDKSYTCKIVATNLAGTSTENTDGTVTVDNTAPPAPTSLFASAVSGGAIELTWTASTPETDVVQYNIYRATGSGGQNYSSPTYQVSAGTTIYTDTSTTDGQTYYYVVRAQDNAGNIETNTNEVSATASAAGPSFSSISADKSAYKNGDTITLTVTLANHDTGCTLRVDFSSIDDQYVTGGESVVNWGTDGVDNDGDGHVDNPAEQGVYVISYLISTVNSQADGSYSVSVTATDGAGNSTSSSISLTLDNTPPSSPTNLSATALSGGGIELTWSASSSSDLAQYNIYRAITSGSEDYSFPTYIVSVATTTYTDTATSDGVTYYYVVRAQDAAGNAETNTNEASATASIVGPSVDVFQIYIKYQGAFLYNLASSTNLHNPGVFAAGKIDEIYLKINLLTGAPLDESSSRITLYKLVDSETQEVSGSQEIHQATGWAELIFHLDPVFDPDVDKYSRDGLYWVDASAVDTADSTNDFDFYFIYDTISPAAPHFRISSFDSATGSITVSGKTVPDELSDPQSVEIFVNDSSRAIVTADADYEFVKSGIGLIRGANYVALQSIDKAGNKSELSRSLKLSYDPESLLSIVIRSPHVVRSGSSTWPVKIIYSLTQPAEVTIRIFNLRGEIVKEWSGSASPGEEIEWDWHGRNMYEQEVNNGVYIFRIKAKAGNGENDSSTKLVAVLR